MPMVRHDAVRKESNLAAVDGVLEELFECGVVVVVVEEDGAFGCSIEDLSVLEK